MQVFISIMKRLILLLLTVFMIGCSPKGGQENTPSPVPSETPDVFSADDSYTAAVVLDHTFSFVGTDVTEEYHMDGVLQAVPGTETAHISENVDSTGIVSRLEGWYEDGRLYSSYNGVQYYDEMPYAYVEGILLVPLEKTLISESMCTEVRREETEAGEKTVYVLKQEDAQKLFTGRYDIYDLSKSSQFSVSGGTVTQTEKNGELVEQSADFTMDMDYSGNPAQVDYHSEVRILMRGETKVNITGEMRDAFASYVSYEDIDASDIDDYTADDSAEATVAGTFRKRLVNRLNYKDEGNDVYTSEYNEGESYTVDFHNHLFTYRNRTSTYVYNWSSDSGGFGSACVYDFRREAGSDSCQESVVEMIRNVKIYFELELYYCGLSLEDLTAEAEGGNG